MGSIDILFSEIPHHTSLLYGLKQTFEAMPHLNKRVVEVGGKSILMNNIITPPPTICNPKYRRQNRIARSIVIVSYWRNRLTVEYNDKVCSPEDIETFTKMLVRNYLYFRHRYIKIRVEDDKVINTLNNQVIAVIG
ncbi:MAG: hypothetical protein J6U73_05465 [Alistipes sp.]|nr:hypothetical protein [Alistipes sp.]